MPTNKDIDELFAEAESVKIQQLKADNLRLLKQLDKAKNKKADLIEALLEAVHTNLRTWDKPKIPKPTVSKRKKDDEIAVAILSDVQLAKVTPDYSTEVAEARVVEYANKIVSEILTDVSYDYPEAITSLEYLIEVFKDELKFMTRDSYEYYDYLDTKSALSRALSILKSDKKLEVYNGNN